MLPLDDDDDGFGGGGDDVSVVIAASPTPAPTPSSSALFPPPSCIYLLQCSSMMPKVDVSWNSSHGWTIPSSSCMVMMTLVMVMIPMMIDDGW